ncbi:MAG: c-type cytochrome, partial [Candidatus Methylomirabilales bacterium]
PRAPGRQAGASPGPGSPAPGPASPPPGDATVQAARELLARIGAGTSPAAAHPGERLFWEKGCGGCHAIRGVGGLTAPDLAGRARKAGRDLAWHVRFLKEPAAVLPGTPMPSYRHLSEQELRTLAEFLMSL